MAECFKFDETSATSFLNSLKNIDLVICKNNPWVYFYFSGENWLQKFSCVFIKFKDIPSLNIQFFCISFITYSEVLRRFWK